VRARFSLLEIYNETIRDLLVDAVGDATRLAVREDPKLGYVVPGLSTPSARSPAAVLRSVSRGLANRAVASTSMNDRSSRSHTVFALHLENRQTGATGVLRLVDLAGSEKWPAGEQLDAKQVAELTGINQSLTTLGNCVSALQAGRAHVPYRESRLTKVLRDSLGGGARVAVVVCLSPAAPSQTESVSSLKFAARAMRVATDAARDTGASAGASAGPAGCAVSGDKFGFFFLFCSFFR
jgi:kinesin family protein C2/C3